LEGWKRKGNSGEKSHRGRLDTFNINNNGRSRTNNSMPPKPDRRGWFDDECRGTLEEKNAAYNKWIERSTRAKRMEY
jgi:hypothetical protein